MASSMLQRHPPFRRQTTLCYNVRYRWAGIHEFILLTPPPPAPAPSFTAQGGKGRSTLLQEELQYSRIGEFRICEIKAPQEFSRSFPETLPWTWWRWRRWRLCRHGWSLRLRGGRWWNGPGLEAEDVNRFMSIRERQMAELAGFTLKFRFNFGVQRKKGGRINDLVSVVNARKQFEY